ncbi:hypothetical protein HCH29_01520 [Enterococcus gilvus]|nr:hypothetical protein [Enterococcus gilvus]
MATSVKIFIDYGGNMYFIIDTDKDGNQTFYDKKRKKVAQIKVKTTASTSTGSGSMFGVISLSNVLVSTILFKLNISVFSILIFIYGISIIAGISAFCWSKSHQTKLLDKNTIDCSTEELLVIFKESTSNERKGLIKLPLFCISFGLFLGGVFYFYNDAVLLLVLIWLITSIGVLLLCDPIIYYLFIKKSLMKMN